MPAAHMSFRRQVFGSLCFYEPERSEDLAVLLGSRRAHNEWQTAAAACQARRNSIVELWDSGGESCIVGLSGGLPRSNMLTAPPPAGHSG